MKKGIGMENPLKICVCVALCAVLGVGAADVVVSGKTGRDIQAAIDKAAAEGGGRVVVPAGEWSTGTIEMRSHVELHLLKGAVLKGSTKEADYNRNDAFPENFWSPGEEWSGGHLVLGYKVEDVAITGEGVIDGNGPAFFGECDEDSRWPWYKYGLKLHPMDRTWFRPGPMVAFFRSKNIRLEGVSLVNTPAWTCHVRCSDGLTVRNVTIDADRTIANSDGFSIDCTRNVLVEKCTLKTGDDGIAIRASCQEKGHAETNLCANVVIRDCDIWSCCYGVRFGIGTGTITNVVVADSRIHEAAEAGFGFTPAWVEAPRNCHILDITVTNCVVSDCKRPVEGYQPGGSRVDAVRFQDCTFNTLLPSMLASDACGVTFARCTRNTIERFKVRHRWGWNERGIRQNRSVFIEGGARGNIRVQDCLPRPLGSSGVLLLAFDDRNFADWERALPLFAKYGAHASFFISGAFDTPAVTTSKRLMAAGHTIGLHGRSHLNVPETIAQRGRDGWWRDEVATEKRRADVAYVPVRSFAYPNNRHDDATDAHLLTRFERLRAGIPGLRPFDPKGEHAADLKPLLSDARMFFPAADLPNRRVMCGIILGEVYHTDIEEVAACIRRAGERKEVLLFTSHGISPDAKGISMKTEWLERILAEAKAADVQVLGFNDLP